MELQAAQHGDQAKCAMERDSVCAEQPSESPEPLESPPKCWSICQS